MLLEPGRVRPAPRPSWLTSTFWDATSKGILVVQRCDACRRLFFRPEAACPQCLSEHWTWEEMNGHASVHSFTVVYRPAIPGMVVPYVVADVLLDEGVHLMTNVIGCDENEVFIGMNVVVEFVEFEDICLPFFRPENQATEERFYATS
jgi:uncharacterized protein